MQELFIYFEVGGNKVRTLYPVFRKCMICQLILQKPNLFSKKYHIESLEETSGYLNLTSTGSKVYWSQRIFARRLPLFAQNCLSPPLDENGNEESVKCGIIPSCAYLVVRIPP